MRVASFFSGIGGFDLGFQNAGHEVVFQCENNQFCIDVLNDHWPQVLKAKDIREVLNDETIIPEADLWCGGFPCQDVSLARASSRAGLRGAKSGLFYPFAELISQRLPRVVVIENVPGLLSSNRGGDFAVILQTLASCGYAVGWRVLNSRYFGIPQQRQRVFIVGCYRNPSGVAQILFEPERGGGDITAGHQSKQKLVSAFKESVGDFAKGPIVQKLGYCLAATAGRHTGTDWSRTYVSYPDKVRRLTPEEAERLQGFPTKWTLPLAYQGDKAEQWDTPRYHALGNAVSVPVAEWLAHRLLL